MAVQKLAMILVLAALLAQGPEVDASQGGIDGKRRSHHFLLSSWNSVPGQADVANGHLSPQTMASLGLLLYVVCLLGVIVMVAVIFSSRSKTEIWSIVVYILALCTVRISVKAVFVGCNFNFPLMLSAIHFVAGAVAAFGVMLYKQRYKGEAIPVPSRRQFVLVILPIAMCFAVCIGVGNQVLELCSVAFTEILMSIQPLMSVPVVLLLGMPFNAWLLPPLFVVVSGCIVVSLGEVHYSRLGLALALISNILRAAKAALQQKMMTGDQNDRLDPCALLAWMCLPSAALMFAWSAVAEGTAPLERIVSHKEKGWPLAFMLILSSVNATVLNLSQLFVVEGLGAVGSQIVGQLKTGLTILGGVVLLSEHVSAFQGAGALIVILGTFIFARIDQHNKVPAKATSSYQRR